MSDRDRNSNYFGSLVTGILVGMGLFYFLDSTEEGEKIKKKIRKKGKQALGDLADSISEFERKGEKFRTQAKRLQSELERKTKRPKKKTAEEARGKLNHIDELRQRGRSASKKFFTRKGKSLSS